MDTLEVLKRSGLLPETSSDQLSALAKLCSKVEYEPRVIIGKQGDEAKKLCVIEEGLVSIIVELGLGREQVVQTASRFDIIGWSAMLPSYRYTATVKTVERTKALVFDGQELRNLRFSNPELGYALYVGIASVLATRLRNTFLQLIGIT